MLKIILHSFLPVCSSNTVVKVQKNVLSMSSDRNALLSPARLFGYCRVWWIFCISVMYWNWMDKSNRLSKISPHSWQKERKNQEQQHTLICLFGLQKIIKSINNGISETCDIRSHIVTHCVYFPMHVQSTNSGKSVAAELVQTSLSC